MNVTYLQQARDFALRGGGSGMIVRHGYLVYSWGSLTTRYDIKSATKSFGATTLGLGLVDGRVSLSGHAQSYLSTFGVPPTSNIATGWLDDITLLHLTTHTAGFEKTGAEGALIFRPGTKWGYSDGGPNWLADVLTTRYQKDLFALMTARVFTPTGIGPTDLVWRSNAYRSDTLNGVKRREFGSGISCDVNAMARLGLLYVRGGVWGSTRIISSTYVAQVSTVQAFIKGLPITNPTQYPNATTHYGMLWWNNADGRMAGVPRDTYWAWGLGDALIIVIPSLDIVVSRAGSTIRATPATDPKLLEPFVQPIVTSTQTSSTTTASTASPESLGPPAPVALVEPEDDAPLVQLTPTPVTPGNKPPVVNAPREITLRLPQDQIRLEGSVKDDGVPSRALTIEWRDLNGTGAVFSSPADPRSFVSFPAAGTYVLQLTASDGELASHADVVVRVLDPNAAPARVPQKAIHQTRSPRATFVGFELEGSAGERIATLRIPIAQVLVPGTIEVHRVLDAWQGRAFDERHPPKIDPEAVATYTAEKDDAGLTVELDVTEAVSHWNEAQAERGFALINTAGHVVIGNVNRASEVEVRLD